MTGPGVALVENAVQVAGMGGDQPSFLADGSEQLVEGFDELPLEL